MRGARPLIWPGVCAASYVVLALLVRWGWTSRIDLAVLHAVRPANSWGPWQIRADYVVEGLRPAVVAGPCVALVVVACILRRSVRPAVLAGLVAGAQVLTVWGTKVIVARPDPHVTVVTDGGSYPSGHTATVALVFGLALLLWRPSATWRLWCLPAGLATLMATCLVVQGAHWVTDVVGAGLLSAAVLRTAALLSPPFVSLDRPRATDGGSSSVLPGDHEAGHRLAPRP